MNLEHGLIPQLLLIMGLLPQEALYVLHVIPILTVKSKSGMISLIILNTKIPKPSGGLAKPAGEALRLIRMKI
jgi:hypothetical protein